MLSNPVVGSVGVAIRVTVKTRDESGTLVGADISAATTKKYRIRKPDRLTVLEVTADFLTDGMNGMLEWTTESAGDLDQAGEYNVQVVLGGLAGFSGQLASASFTVDRRI